MASGSYIAFLDSDDVWLPSKLTDQIEAMISENYYFSHTNYIKRDLENRLETPIKVGKKNYGILRTAFWCRIATPTVVFKREVYDDLRFNPNIKVGEDILFWLECCEKGSILAGLDQTNCIVNVTSASHSADKKNATSSHKVINSYLFMKRPALSIVHGLYLHFRKVILSINDVFKPN